MNTKFDVFTAKMLQVQINIRDVTGSEICDFRRHLRTESFKFRLRRDVPAVCFVGRHACRISPATGGGGRWWMASPFLIHDSMLVQCFVF